MENDLIFIIVVAVLALLLCVLSVVCCRRRHFGRIRRHATTAACDELEHRLGDLNTAVEATVVAAVDKYFPSPDMNSPVVQELVAHMVRDILRINAEAPDGTPRSPRSPRRTINDPDSPASEAFGEVPLQSTPEDAARLPRLHALPDPAALLAGMQAATVLRAHCRGACAKAYANIGRLVQSQGAHIFQTATKRRGGTRGDHEEGDATEMHAPGEGPPSTEQAVSTPPESCWPFWACCCCLTWGRRKQHHRKHRGLYFLALSTLFCSGVDINNADDNDTGNARRGRRAPEAPFSAIGGGDQRLLHMGGSIARHLVHVTGFAKDRVSVARIPASIPAGGPSSGPTDSGDTTTVVSITPHPNLLSEDATRAALFSVFHARVPCSAELLAPAEPALAPSHAAAASAADWADEITAAYPQGLAACPDEDDGLYFSAGGVRDDLYIFFTNLRAVLVRGDTRLPETCRHYPMYTCIQRFDAEAKRWLLRLSVIVAAEAAKAYDTAVRIRTRDICDGQLLKAADRLALRLSRGQALAPVMTPERPTPGSPSPPEDNPPEGGSTAADGADAPVVSVCCVEDERVRESVATVLTQALQETGAAVAASLVPLPGALQAFTGDHGGPPRPGQVVPQRKAFTRAIATTTQEIEDALLGQLLQQVPLLAADESCQREARRQLQPATRELLDLLIPEETPAARTPPPRRDARARTPPPRPGHANPNNSPAPTLLSEVFVLASRTAATDAQTTAAAAVARAESDLCRRVLCSFAAGGPEAIEAWEAAVLRLGRPIAHRLAVRLHLIRVVAVDALKLAAACPVGGPSAGHLRAQHPDIGTRLTELNTALCKLAQLVRTDTETAQGAATRAGIDGDLLACVLPAAGISFFVSIVDAIAVSRRVADVLQEAPVDVHKLQGLYRP